MKRRDFMRLGGVTAGGVAAAAGPAAAQQGGNNSSGGGGGNQSGGGNASGGGNQSGSGSGGGGPTKEVAVGPGGQLVFEPEEIQIPAGGTIKWVWESGGHNVVPEGGGDWGHEPVENQGFTYSHTFDSAGENAYVCQPHASAGMVGTVMVGSGSSGGGGGEEEVDPEEMGVPIQAHYVGIGTILALILSLGYSFFVLKYGESPHAKGGNN